MKHGTQQPEQPSLKCPHCGWEFFHAVDGLVPTHDFPKPCRMVCPGSRQAPRSTADVRPLWKDERK